MQKAPRRRSPDITRAQIIEAAMQTVHEAGAAGFTLDAVVARLPVSKGALLHHFPSKAELLKGLLDQVAQAFVEAVEAQAARDPRPAGRYARAYLAVTVEQAAAPEEVSRGKAVLVACLLEPALAARWRWWMAKITRDEPADPAGADDALLQRLAADGLWLSDILGAYEIPTDQRRALVSILGAALPPQAAR